MSDRIPTLQIDRLTPAHVAEYRAIMLQAYASEPHAFTSTASERAPLPLEWWNTRVADQPNPTEMVLGAFVDARLIGVAGLRFGRRERTRHKAFLYGLFVLPQFRGQGIARALVEAVLDQAHLRPAARVVQLTVRESNAPAIRLYESCGFTPFGTEPFAIQAGERYVSLVHMWRAVGPASV